MEQIVNKWMNHFFAQLSRRPKGDHTTPLHLLHTSRTQTHLYKPKHKRAVVSAVVLAVAAVVLAAVLAAVAARRSSAGGGAGG